MTSVFAIGGNHVRTVVTEPLFLDCGQRVEIRCHDRSEAEIGHDPKGMSGGPVFDVVSDDAGELRSCPLAVAVEKKLEHGVAIAARLPTIMTLLDRKADRRF